MKKLFVLLLVSLPLLSIAAEGDTLKFWVQLSDKKGTPYSIDKPEKFLSKRAIERRKKQNIKITEEDLPVNPAYVKEIAAAGVDILNTTKWLNAVTIQTADMDKVTKLKTLPFVKEVRKIGVKSGLDNSRMDYLMEMLSSLIDLKIDESPYGAGFNQINMLNGVELHKMGYKGEGIVIAILDGGFMNVQKLKTFNHLFTSGRILGTRDFVKGDTMVFEDNNHGMNVLSCMASNTPDTMIGTAPGASYWLLRTEDANTEYPIEEANWATGAEFADSVGADVINSSLGYTEFDDKTMNYEYKDLTGKKSPCSMAATIAARKGIIVCNAAGNEGDGGWKYVGTPADADSIITVGGVDSEGEHASFSSYGPTADGRIKPTVMAQGQSTTVSSVTDKFYASNGTSFSSPVLCGLVACLVQANPNKTNMEIIEAIKWSADRYSNPDNTYGYGIPDFMLANRYLGGDKNFDYKKEFAEGKITDKITVLLYAPKNEKVQVKVSKAGSMVAEMEEQLQAGKFKRYSFDAAVTSGTGVYNVEVTIGKKKFKFDLTKE